MRFVSFIIVGIFICHCIHLVMSFSSGAPGGACVDMQPAHTTDPDDPGSPLIKDQDIKAEPVYIQLSSLTVAPLDSLNIELIAKQDKTFKGFFIQVRQATGRNDVARGTFEPEADEPVKAMDCSGNKNAATHKGPDIKQKVKVRWTAPSELGEYLVYYSLVAERKTFWPKVAHKETIVVQGPQPPTEPPTSTDLKEKLGDIYSKCGKTVGCFGIPEHCWSDFDASSNHPSTCTLLVTWRLLAKNEAEFYLTGRFVKPQEGGYIAVGLSDDKKMGSDSVAVCSVDGPHHNDSPKVWRSYNKGQESSDAYSDPALAFRKLASWNIEQHIGCHFVQYNHKINDISVDLAKAYFLLIARGPVSEDNKPYKIGWHDVRAYPPAKVKLSDYAELGASEEGELLVRFHAGLMLFAWVTFSGTGIFISRYFRQTFIGKKLLGRPYWMVFHVGCMVSSQVLSLGGFLAIFLKEEEIDAKYVHSILGLIVLSVQIPQGIFPLFRNMIPDRRIFKWVHFCVGILLYLLAYVTIFLALLLDHANLEPVSGQWIGLCVATLLFHLTMNAIMTYHMYWADGQLQVGPEFRYRALCFGPMGPNGVFAEAPGTRFRYLMLVLYGIGAVFFTSLLIATIAR